MFCPEAAAEDPGSHQWLHKLAHLLEHSLVLSDHDIVNTDDEDEGEHLGKCEGESEGEGQGQGQRQGQRQGQAQG